MAPSTSRIQRLAIAGALALSGMVCGSDAITAQGSPKPDFEPDFYEMMLTGYEVEVSGDFVIEDVLQQNYVDGENEQLSITSGFAVVEVSVFDDADSPDETIGMWLAFISEGMETFDVVDNGVDGDVSWSYAIGGDGTDTFAIYVQMEKDVQGNIDVFESILALDGELVESLEAAQDEITIDGDAFMDEVDPDDLQDLVDGRPFRDGEDDINKETDEGDNAEPDDGNRS